MKKLLITGLIWKIIFSAFLLIIVFSVWTSNALDISDTCKKLIDGSSETKLKKLAKEVCGHISTLQKENTLLRKSIKKQNKKEEGKWSDTSISLADVKKIQSDSIIVWDSKARFLIIEYSDLQCPFCARHWNAKTLQTIVDTYKGKVAKTFRHFPLWFHQLAIPGALGTECAAMQGKDNYYKFIGWVFAKWLKDIQTLEDVATELKLDMKKRKECQSNEGIKSRVARQMKEGTTLFSVTGTPGNVILDTVTWQFKLIAGAYPVKSFEDELNKAIKE